MRVVDAPACTLDLIMDAESTADVPSSETTTGGGVEAAADQNGGGQSAREPSVPRANRRMRAATILMVPALLAFVGSAALFLVPVTNPGVQQCGPPAWFLLQAETNQALVTDDGKPLHGWDDARLRQAHDDRCSVQVADRAVPAGILLVTFWVLALAAVILGWTGRRALRKHLTVDRQ